MGHIKEPVGIDFVVDPTPLTNEDRKKISEIIAYYKATGQKMLLAKSMGTSRPRVHRLRPTRHTNAKKKEQSYL